MRSDKIESLGSWMQGAARRARRCHSTLLTPICLASGVSMGDSCQSSMTARPRLGAAVMRSNAFLTLVARAAAEAAGGAHPGQPRKAKHMRGGRGPQCSRIEGRSRRA